MAPPTASTGVPPRPTMQGRPAPAMRCQVGRFSSVRGWEGLREHDQPCACWRASPYASDPALTSRSTTDWSWTGIARLRGWTQPAGQGGPSRRPGQRYVPRGVKEGPMKGFVPPSRVSISNEPQPDYAKASRRYRGNQRKSLAEEMLGLRAKDLIARLLTRGDSRLYSSRIWTRNWPAKWPASLGPTPTSSHLRSKPRRGGHKPPLARRADRQKMLTRPPVVTIIGLEEAAGLEFGPRIEWWGGGRRHLHIGAYKVTNWRRSISSVAPAIVFLDNPGHEAFSRSRWRGAKATEHRCAGSGSRRRSGNPDARGHRYTHTGRGSDHCGCQQN